MTSLPKIRDYRHWNFVHRPWGCNLGGQGEYSVVHMRAAWIILYRYERFSDRDGPLERKNGYGFVVVPELADATLTEYASAWRRGYAWKGLA
jgi:hypothetical protein